MGKWETMVVKWEFLVVKMGENGSRLGENGRSRAIVYEKVVALIHPTRMKRG